MGGRAFCDNAFHAVQGERYMALAAVGVRPARQQPEVVQSWQPTQQPGRQPQRYPPPHEQPPPPPAGPVMGRAGQHPPPPVEHSNVRFFVHVL